MGGKPRLLRIPGFAPLAGSYALNELGDNLGVIALAVLVLDRTGSAVAVTALFLFGKFVPAFLSPALTAALDRRPVGQVLPVLYTVEGAAFLGLAALAHSFSLPGVLALAFVDGTLALTGRGLSRGAIAAVLTPAGALREGNALLNVAFAAASAGGPALAGVVVHFWGVGTALTLDAGSFLLVAALLLACSRRLPVPEARPHEGWLTRVRDGLAYVRSHPTAGRLVGGEALAIIFFTVTVPIEVVYAREALDSTSLGYGILLAAWGAGILIGSAVFARAGQRPLSGMILLSTAAIGLGYAVMAVSPTLAVACVGSLVGGIGNGVQWIAVMTALQEAVDADYQARAAGLLESAAAAMPGIGYVLGGLLTATVSSRLAFVIAAAGIAVVVTAWARRPLVPERVVA